MTKSDHYLTLCLEHAALSPLRHRHGCIVVRGGKVLGAGHNAHRPGGYDGGTTLKHGGALSSSKPKSNKPKLKPKPNKSHHPPISSDECKCFDSMSGGGAGGGNGRHANAPLTMHAEMMALADAVARSCSARAGRALSGQKPRGTGGSKKVKKKSVRPENRGADVESREGKTGIEKPRGFGCNKPYPGGKTNTGRPYRVFTTKTPEVRNHARLLPKGQPGTAASSAAAPSHAVKDRTKYRCLLGADLYVARLGHRQSPANLDCAPRAALDGASSEHFPPAMERKPAATDSLHDELTCSTVAVVREEVEAVELVGRESVMASRPCYRCVEFMHNVGVKRVFWTNEKGAWEGAKVRDLVDELEGMGGCGEDGKAEYGDKNGGSTAVAPRVYITKHEVLMLKRLMGDGDG